MTTTYTMRRRIITAFRTRLQWERTKEAAIKSGDKPAAIGAQTEINVWDTELDRAVKAVLEST